MTTLSTDSKRKIKTGAKLGGRKQAQRKHYCPYCNREVRGNGGLASHKKACLRIVDNNTDEYQGGLSVETPGGTILAGPYASQDDAKEAKRDLLAGRYPPEAR